MNYSDAVKLLSEYALNQDGSGARIAAQVLLSTYNSYNYHVALVDLCSLDDKGYQAALAVIRGRAESFTEPHEVIDNGAAVFDRLETRWAHLRTGTRYADKYRALELVTWQCPHCGNRIRDYAEGPFPGRNSEGKPFCDDTWTDKHPEDEHAVMERVG